MVDHSTLLANAFEEFDRELCRYTTEAATETDMKKSVRGLRRVEAAARRWGETCFDVGQLTLMGPFKARIAIRDVGKR